MTERYRTIPDAEAVEMIDRHEAWLKKEEGAEGRKAVFDNAQFDNQDFFKSRDISGASFRGVLLQRCDLTSAILTGAQFTDAAQLSGCKFEDAKLADASFSGAYLAGAKFAGADLQNTDFTDANLSGATGVRFDNCRVSGVIMSGKTREDWTRLKQEYTGSRFVFSLLLLAIFFLPFVVKAAVFLALSNAQAAGIPGLSITAFCAGHACREVNLASVIFGLEERHFLLGGFGFLLTGVMLVYNGARLFLTFNVSRLKDKEAATNRSPRYAFEREVRGGAIEHWRNFSDAYQPLLCAHGFVSVAQWVAGAAFALNALHWLGLSLRVPG